MSIFVMADLHLSTDSKKPMDIFGVRWVGYMEKISSAWRAVVKPEDTVVVPGDISWALTLPDAVSDLRWLDSLPGTKFLGKGNHDFWWSTSAKMTKLFDEHGFRTLKILYNNAYTVENRVLCGTRGWFLEEKAQKTVGEVDYQKIVNRECIRFRMSLDAAKKEQEANGGSLPIDVFLHFPPVWENFVCHEFMDLMHEYGVNSCYFGHIHGMCVPPTISEYEGIKLHLIASDHLNFRPLCIS